MARALADCGAVKVLSGLLQTSMQQKWARLVCTGGIALAAAVNGLQQPLKQVQAYGSLKSPSVVTFCCAISMVTGSAGFKAIGPGC